MKILFVGEGNHDIGPPAPFSPDPRPAQGSIPVLSRHVAPSVDSDSLALPWKDLPRFDPKAKKHGYRHKINAAVLMAARRYGCVGTIVVADRDGKEERESSLKEAAENAKELVSGHSVVWGIAHESVEAWTLAAVRAISEVLGIENEEDIKKLYPPGVHVESLKESSGKDERQPKRLLAKVFALKHEEDSTEIRQAIAEKTDIAELKKACPRGFAPFAERLHQGFNS